MPVVCLSVLMIASKLSTGLTMQLFVMPVVCLSVLMIASKVSTGLTMQLFVMPVVCLSVLMIASKVSTGLTRNKQKPGIKKLARKSIVMLCYLTVTLTKIMLNSLL